MSLILCIDTSLENAFVALANGGKICGLRTNSTQLDHAAWIHTAIREFLLECGKKLSDLDAVAVTSGPGSYTGLRVGMSTAKGMCFALGIPLITETTLRLMAIGVKSETGSEHHPLPVLYCPMIDARRSEVFCALYDDRLEVIEHPAAIILQVNSFDAALRENVIIFSGNGSSKWENICKHPNARFTNTLHQPADFAHVAAEKFEIRQFSDLAYTEPDYFKNVYTGK